MISPLPLLLSVNPLKISVISISENISVSLTEMNDRNFRFSHYRFCSTLARIYITCMFIPFLQCHKNMQPVYEIVTPSIVGP